ncbi:MAG: ATP synthase subunit I [Leptolyngbyaceae cyanobacterium MO_188.B28]|nr:ATP synthase subunit I [Leptolyngbyaceae cyanobacterium MO_188.B28]
MDSSNEYQEDPSIVENSESSGLPPEPDSSMQEYAQLQRELLMATLVIAGIVFFSTWIFYTLNTALNYVIGACTGVVYLKLLARNVEQLGREKEKVGKSQLALFVGLIIVASQLDQLQIIPIFFGFLTYKAAVIVYMVKTLFDV